MGDDGGSNIIKFPAHKVQSYEFQYMISDTDGMILLSCGPFENTDDAMAFLKAGLELMEKA